MQKIFRNQKGLTLEQLAEQFDVSKGNEENSITGIRLYKYRG